MLPCDLSSKFDIISLSASAVITFSGDTLRGSAHGSPSVFNLNNVTSFSRNWRVRVLVFLLVFVVYSQMCKR